MPRLAAEQSPARGNHRDLFERPLRRTAPRGNTNAAAIAGALAAEHYGLRILEADIQDNSANATRFLVLGRQCSPPTGQDRTSIMFSIADEVGALHRALAPFRRYQLNMTKIESRPSKRKAWEYFFFVDCDGHMHDKRVAKAIEYSRPLQFRESPRLLPEERMKQFYVLCNGPCLHGC